MSLVKIEFDLPEFKNNLEVSIMFQKDGEGVVRTTTPSKPVDNGVKITSVENNNPTTVTTKPVNNQNTINGFANVTTVAQQNQNTSAPKKPMAGNMMGIDF